MQNEHTLNELGTGRRAIVLKLRAHGSMRRRLLDIGLTEGAAVECVGKSPAGDPAAYLIRGAVIAIRSEDSSDVVIEQEVSNNALSQE